jgi:hypothetical protein
MLGISLWEMFDIYVRGVSKNFPKPTNKDER